jgi:hypothetical protein
MVAGDLRQGVKTTGGVYNPEPAAGLAAAGELGQLNADAHGHAELKATCDDRIKVRVSQPCGRTVWVSPRPCAAKANCYVPLHQV